MRADKITISIDSDLLLRVDRLVKERIFPSRSSAFQHAVLDKVERLERNRLARELAKLDVREEQRMADEGLAEELDEWPPY